MPPHPRQPYWTRSPPGLASPQDPPHEAPPQSCSMATNSGTSTRTAARLTFPSPPTDARKCVEAGRAKEWFSNWVSKRLANDADAQDGLALLRERYDARRAPIKSADR